MPFHMITGKMHPFFDGAGNEKKQQKIKNLFLHGVKNAKSIQKLQKTAFLLNLLRWNDVRIKETDGTGLHIGFNFS